MADVAHASSRTSSLAQSLIKKDHVHSAQYTPSIRKSAPGSYRERTVQASESTVNVAGGTFVWSLPRIGLVRQGAIRFELTGVDLTTYDGTNGPAFAPALVAAMVEKVELRTHSRILSTVNSDVIHRFISTGHNHLIKKELAGYDFQANDTPANAAADIYGFKAATRGATNPIYVYLPLDVLSCFRDEDGRHLATSFVETCQIAVTVRNVTSWCGAGTNGTAPTGITASLITESTCLFPDEHKAYVSASYKPNSTTQSLWENWTLIGSKNSVSVTPNDLIVTTTVDPITTTAVGLCRSIMVVATRSGNRTGALWSDDDTKVHRVALTASGRKMFDLTRDEAEYFALRPAKDTVGDKWAQGFYLPFVSDDKDSSYSSGWLSFSGLSSQTWEIELKTHEANGAAILYDVKIYACLLDVKSIQAQSGAILSSLSV